MSKKQETKFYYWIKSHPTDFNLCPLCDTKLEKSSDNESFCSKCAFRDGIARLTEKEAEKIKDKIIKTINCPF